MIPSYLGLALIGVVLLAIAWPCWRGTFRRWIRSPLASWMVSVVPGFGVACLLWAAGSTTDSFGWQTVFFLPGVLIAVAAFAVGSWDPPWLGPQWYRRLRAQGLTGPGASAATSPEPGNQPADQQPRDDDVLGSVAPWDQRRGKDA